jgi:hypothetical protein
MGARSQLRFLVSSELYEIHLDNEVSPYPQRSFSVDTKVLIEKLKLQLPSQPTPRLVGQKQNYEIEVPTVR